MAASLLQVRHLTKQFPLRGGLSGIFSKDRPYVHAVDDVTFEIAKGEVLGLVGESGSGKTTVAKLVDALIPPTKGEVIFEERNLFSIKSSELKKTRREFQLIFQDPYGSLNPRKSVFEIISQPLNVHDPHLTNSEKLDIVQRTLELVKLFPAREILQKRPSELSGGQRQRVAIARALVLNPKLIIADEAVSMLDVSVKAEIVNLLIELKQKLGLSYLFITHDMGIARYVCDRIAVMYLGKIVELGPAEKIVSSPLHYYTRALINSSYEPDPDLARKPVEAVGEIGSPINPPGGCRYNPRCPRAEEICKSKEPPLEKILEGQFSACHFARDLLYEKSAAV